MFAQLVPKLVRRYHIQRYCSAQRRLNHSLGSAVETDSCGIPLKPTWSVQKLLSSYPEPSISPATFKRLHELSALLPPAEESQEYNDLKTELEGLVKLVDAVKLIKVTNMQDGQIPDGRIWAEGTGIPIAPASDKGEEDLSCNGQDLLSHASRTSNGLYVVDADRSR
ncbi:hypothetical protein BJ138DRAFT_1074552 [Hygrophoropsis aurantiaca]|uniref:Uncharacterized protein n=1 Tax=Hygrophoropsis aurantiaca TaxID=72124 RepID=A0ACB8AUG0_9AGAM|nr:hypothetical protein BJ138DRAFT_1074552 [Hygrophoropsis aurantiaca]